MTSLPARSAVALPASPAARRLARAAARAEAADAIEAALLDALREALAPSELHLLRVDAASEVAEGAGYAIRLGDDPSAAGAAVASGRPVAVPDVERSAVVRADLAERFAVGSVLLVPVAWRDGAVAAVAVAGWSAPRPIADADVAAAELLADVAAAGLARLDARRRASSAAVRDAALARAARALNASLDGQEVLRALAREASLALGAGLTGVYLGDGEHGAVAAAGDGVAEAWHGMTIRPGEGAAGKVLETGRPFVAADYQRDVRLPDDSSLRHHKSALAVPIEWDGRLRGVLSVGWTELHALQDDELETLEAIAGLASIACRNAEAYEAVQHAARTDALTGLLNHGAMQVRIREEIARAQRDGAPLSCVIVDLDDFKQVNDSRGHQAGDELLRTVAGLLSADLRPYDQVARYGGDEFVLLLPGTEEDVATQVAERVRDAVTGASGACSVGVATWHEGMDADGLLEQADRALMLAKRTGKDRVAVANAEVERELALLHSRRGSPAAVQALAAAIEERDAYTHEHSEQVVHLARGVAMVLGLPAPHVDRIAHAALLHDVGKLAIPTELLAKSGPLTSEEWAVMAEHPVVGERILARTPDLAPIAPIVRHEHEHWDGTGYPDGLAGHRIPVGSRIILACDAYKAMTAGRPYRPAMPREEAIAQLQAGAGRQFDPEIVEALLDLLGLRKPDVPDRAAGVRIPPPPPESPSGRRSRTRWEPGA